MASFSKQYVESQNLDMPWDFDLEETFSSLGKGFYQATICEGFRFSAVGVDNEGNRMVFIQDFESQDGGEWIMYKSLLNRKV
jgi:hypothetical protein